jgi:hypothetical protein
MALPSPPSNDRKRVKVYELKASDWYDRGTGFCTGAVVNVSNHFPSALHLFRTPVAFDAVSHFADGNMRGLG